MAGNSFGKVFRLTTYGESHGKAIGLILDGCPAGLALDLEMLQYEMDRRRPGQSQYTTARSEKDRVQILSGVFEGKTTGTPIAMQVINADARTKDYDHLSDSYRPSHADFTYDKKYGHRDYRGGGRSSARETAMRVAAGAIAKQLLGRAGISIRAYVSQIGIHAIQKGYQELNLEGVEENPLRCPDPAILPLWEEYLTGIRREGDTVGGIIQLVVTGCPVGLGEPVFDKLHADLAKAMLSINACKGFEYGSGFAGTRMRGSEHNDPFVQDQEGVRTLSNHSGGIQGGISNGMDIHARVAFKPVATLMKNQTSVDREGREVQIEGKGRHDPCVVPRAVPIVEAMAALVLADHWLRAKICKL